MRQEQGPPPAPGRTCPKCGSPHIQYQREQAGSVGASQNSVVVMPAKRTKGCLYWICFGWFFDLMYWMLVGWWWRLLFGGKRKKGWNLNASKTLNHTVAICQNCGHSWKV